MRFQFISAVILLSVVSITFAADTPDDIIKSKGLIKAGSSLILPVEAEVHDLCKTLRAAKAKVAGEIYRRKDLDAKIDRAFKTLDGLRQELITASQDLIRNPNDNRYIGAHNAALEAVDLQKSKIADLLEQQDKMANSRTDYITATLDASDKTANAASDYDDVSKDPDLAAAIAKYNLTAHPKVKLGPSPYFLEDLAFIAACKKEVSSNTIPISMEGNIPHVDVLINGTVAKNMIWDSGASLVTLSAATAAELDLHPPADALEMVLTIANGSTVKAHVMKLDSIRVGGFIVPDVECVVMPPGHKSDDLLGGTFQHHFQCKLDAQAGTLQLTPIDPLATATGATSIKSHRRKPGNSHTIDLLAGIDVSRQAAAGKWTADGNAIVSDTGSKTRIDFNYRPPEEYDFKVTFSRLSGNDDFDMILSKDGHTFSWLLGGWGNSVSGIECVRGQYFDSNPTTIRMSLENGKTYTCLVKVRSTGISSYLDGKLFSQYQTDYLDLGYPSVPLHHRDTLGVATWGSNVTVSAAEVTEITGTGEIVTDAPEPEMQPIATVDYFPDSDHKTLKLFADGRLDCPGCGPADARWFLHGDEIDFLFYSYFDSAMLSADRKSFEGHIGNFNPLHGRIATGNLPAEAQLPELKEGADGWTVLFRSDDPGIWDRPQGSPTARNGYSADVYAAPAQTHYLRIRRMSDNDAIIIPIQKLDLHQNTDAWAGSGLLHWGGFHLGVKNPQWHTHQSGLVDIGDDHQGWGFGHTIDTNQQAEIWNNEMIPKTVLEISVKTSELTAEERAILLSQW